MQIKQGMWLKHWKFGTVDSFDPEKNSITLFFRNLETKEISRFSFTIEELARVNNKTLRYDPEVISAGFFAYLAVFVAVTSFFWLWKIALVGYSFFFAIYFLKAWQRSQWLKRYPNYHKVL